MGAQHITQKRNGVKAMKLELYDEDLASEHKGCPTSSVGFNYLTPTAQEAVRVVGKATFYRCRGSNQENYNVVYPPKK